MYCFVLVAFAQYYISEICTCGQMYLTFVHSHHHIIFHCANIS